MPEVDELKRRARRAESEGDLREALELYRSALRAERQGEDEGAPDPGLLLRIGDLEARLDDRDAAVDVYLRASERYAGRGQLTNAVAVCEKLLRAFPDEVEGYRILADLQSEIGLTAEARGNLIRYLDAVEEGEGELGRAVRAARSFLESDPDQEVAVRAARVLDGEGRTAEAIELLRRAWERRTGRRRPAGEIERLARRIDPDVDLGSWTPEWPPLGDDAAGRAAGPRPAAVGPNAVGGAGSGDDAAETDGGAAPVEEVRVGEAGDEDVPDDRETPEDRPLPDDGAVTDDERAAATDDEPEPVPAAAGISAVDGPGRGNGAAETGGGDAGEEQDPGGGFVRRYGREPGGGGTSGAPRRLRGGDGEARATDGARTADGDGGLRRGLAVLEELLALAPDDPGLRRRKVAYARRLGEPGLLEEALVELGDLLADRGAHRGARLVYEEVLDHLDPESDRASAGLRALEAPDDVRPTPDGEDPDAEPAGPAAEIDREFRRRLSDGLEQVPRELARLQAAARAATGGAGSARVSWRAHREMGRFLLLRGRPDEAAGHLRAARARAPDGGEADADLLYHLGIAHRRSGRPEDARESFRRLADRDPGFAVAWAAVSP